MILTRSAIEILALPFATPIISITGYEPVTMSAIGLLATFLLETAVWLTFKKCIKHFILVSNFFLFNRKKKPCVIYSLQALSLFLYRFSKAPLCPACMVKPPPLLWWPLWLVTWLVRCQPIAVPARRNLTDFGQPKDCWTRRQNSTKSKSILL